jgi:acid phosphatase family membrane protein YuiD
MKTLITIMLDMLTNFPLIVSISSMFLAQGIKILYYYFKEGDLNVMHFFESGGMPSAHSSMVTALTVSIGLISGWDSVFFAVSLVLSIVVMYDAMGVRRAASKQAYIVNKLVDDIYNDGNIEIEKLKEIIGHSPAEVLMGSILGFILAMIAYIVIYL